ncbi:cytochrome c oxidase assembly protein COX15 homolog [Copidosoma floridanum]|uniref:cytochrome c oxidase assembly protein COX15 homolog n=1 Tax=Copidosoma floridanum TaxID=29053 RepID=UPI0006C97671|nr:cytochrome c oxidase assembly protein COX15 homolog [Copidosoma floridanum]
MIFYYADKYVVKKFRGSKCSTYNNVNIVLGGITRLTESGLSMVTWKFLGEKIPSNEQSWLIEFDKYKQFPEFQILNRDITIEEFKRIWSMEYVHRMWGRLFGMIFIVPASIFWLNNMLEPLIRRRIIVLGSLILCQGLMGWYMVKSGLVNKFDGPSDVPRVSQYRLAAHLSLAFLIYSGFFYTALDYLRPVHGSIPSYSLLVSSSHLKQLKKLKFACSLIAGLTFLTAVSGAFVAGLDAGLIYNTFPKMCDKWIPDDIFYMTPALKNFTENPATAQFDHRLLGLSTLAVSTYIGIMSRTCQLSTRAFIAGATVFAMAYLQAAMGILTLLYHVPMKIAAAHQSGSLLLMTTIMWFYHELRHLKKLPK